MRHMIIQSLPQDMMCYAMGKSEPLVYLCTSASTLGHIALLSTTSYFVAPAAKDGPWIPKTMPPTYLSKLCPCLLSTCRHVI